MFTIGQVSRHTGVPARTIRFYHGQGVFPEPARDASGYRRYNAREIAMLIKIRRLAAAGVPLAEIPDLLAASSERFGSALTSIDAALAAKIDELQETRRQLRELASGADNILPEGVAAYLEQLRAIGLSEFWISSRQSCGSPSSPVTPTGPARCSPINARPRPTRPYDGTISPMTGPGTTPWTIRGSTTSPTRSWPRPGPAIRTGISRSRWIPTRSPT